MTDASERVRETRRELNAALMMLWGVPDAHVEDVHPKIDAYEAAIRAECAEAGTGETVDE